MLIGLIPLQSHPICALSQDEAPSDPSTKCTEAWTLDFRALYIIFPAATEFAQQILDRKVKLTTRVYACCLSISSSPRISPHLSIVLYRVRAELCMVSANITTIVMCFVLLFSAGFKPHN